MRGKLKDGKIIPAPKYLIIDNTKYINPTDEMLANEGFKEIEYTMPPEAPEDYHYESHWEESDTIHQVWELAADEPERIVQRLKVKLEESDYKIIKCSESALIGGDLPYDIQELHEERQALRDRINELENDNE